MMVVMGGGDGGDLGGCDGGDGGVMVVMGV